LSQCEVDVLLVFADPVLFPSVSPYGLDILGAQLSAIGLRVRTFLPMLEQDPVEAMRRVMVETRPQIVGFSFRNLDEAGFGIGPEEAEVTFIDCLVDLVGAAKNGRALLVLGGAGFSIAPTEILQITGSDMGFVGPSEMAFANFCVRVVKLGESPHEAARDIPNAAFPGHIPPSAVSAELGRPQGYSRDTIEWTKLTGGTIAVRTKTGCSRRCVYCVVPNIERQFFRSWGDIRAELAGIVECGLEDRVFVADGEFNLPSAEYAIAICRNIRRDFGEKIRWRCYLDPGSITVDLIDAMRASGCVGASLTSDSYTETGRGGMKKGASARDAVAASEALIHSGIGTTINIILGGPGETIETVTETALTARRFMEAGALIAVTIGLRVYPRTPLADMIKESCFKPFYRECERYRWLGTYCSPASPADLYDVISQILPPCGKIHYTHHMESDDRAYYRDIAHGAKLLADGNHTMAKMHFRSLTELHPTRLEARLGLLKAEVAGRRDIPSIPSD